MTKIRQFIEEINRELAPVLKIGSYSWPSTDKAAFKVSLCDSAYCDSGTINVNDKFVAMIEDRMEQYTDKKVCFNNTQTIFWTENFN